ncbi:protein kinase domain-containing protein [Pseudogulbenkiania subflava]|uniref:Serine/threonine protein kinase n=1 Tax=Pseudogulbenkiania subflava DSM 22618 TaxID=1123014 RepID=A0A1Y6C3J9_9NEIS|nr:protein kinase [Pseudogulbenkiania subflava]SMF40015.1 serine/threonine protein kinase [Pseudogulbenkiania subflava DSM 22618]
MKLPQRYKTLTKSVLAGGFGTVIPLEDTFLRRVVLLKVMQDTANNAQLQNELKGLCKARSRHVVEVYDVILNDNGEITGVVIERLRGRDFSAFHKEAESNPQLYIKILYQLACALRDLHAVGIVHRDLKLDNFKESAAGVVKLFDFGISSSDGGYQTKQNKGTLIYAAPELYVPGATITPEMDIYALGVCAWALAHPKFPTQLLEMPPQTSGRASSISTVMPTADKQADGLHKEVIDILYACLDPQPKNRPSADQISSVLARHLSRNKHRGLFVQGMHKVFELSAKQPSVTLKIGTLGQLKVTYDGLRFSIAEVDGSVSINNVPAEPGNVLHEACVLGFGDTSLGSSRQWVTFFSSHPEVVI